MRYPHRAEEHSTRGVHHQLQRPVRERCKQLIGWRVMKEPPLAERRLKPGKNAQL